MVFLYPPSARFLRRFWILLQVSVARIGHIDRCVGPKRVSNVGNLRASVLRSGKLTPRPAVPWRNLTFKQQQWPEILTAEFGTASDERRVHARKLAGVGTPEPNSDRAAFGAITSAGSARELFDANT